MATATASAGPMLKAEPTTTKRFITNKKVDIKKAQANDVDDDEEEEEEVKAPVVDEKAVAEARVALDKAKANYEHAKTALAQLIGKPLKMSSGPGVIQTIFNLIKESGKKGITKEALLVELVKLFPEREEAGMTKTINVQLPKRMSKEKKVNIVKSEDGKFSIK